MLKLTDYIAATKRHPYSHDVLFREVALDRLLQVVDRRAGNNVLLVGEPGVGKTALLRGLAWRWAHGRLPNTRRQEIWEVGAGDLALRLTELSREEMGQLQRELSGRRRILFIDDAKLLLDKVDGVALTFFLKPLLESPETVVVLACTVADCRQYIESNPILAREFERLVLDELSDDEAASITAKISGLEARAVGLGEADAEVAVAAVGLAKRYLTERAQPDRSLMVLRSALARCRRAGRSAVTVDDCRAVVADRTGLPLQSLTTADRSQILNLPAMLNEQIIGQTAVVQSIASVIQRARAGLKDPRRPLASFLFLGTSGVGKTEMAKVLAKTVLGNERALVRFDMSEFNEAHAAQRLIGAPPGYVGYEEGGQLTNAVLAQPYSVILLDEIEKAHPRVFDIFLQVLDDGRLTDSKGRTVNFGDTLIIATSNLAVQEILDGWQAGTDVTTRAWAQQQIMPMLIRFFRPEFINRFDDVMVFKPFTRDESWQIAQLELAKLRERLAAHRASITLDEPELRAVIDELYDPAFGARPIRRYIQESVETKLAQQILTATMVSEQVEARP